MSRVVEHTLVGVPQLPGTISAGAVLGPYSIVSHLARGGMANVWVARHHGARGFSKLVALKTLLPEFAEDAAFQRMFFEEARLAALIRHPQVCEIFELIELNGLLTLSMEWVDGDSLSTLIQSAPGPLDRRIAARIIAQAAAGLHAAHELRDDGGRELNLVHRDVSPQNILISSDGHVKLSDFGIAKVLYSQRENTAVGIVRGKLPYMSPEQACTKPLDRRSDIFSLGSVLFLATLGARPFFQPQQSRQDGLASLLRGDYPRPRELDPDFPKELEAIIDRALQRDLDARYATAAAFRRDLEEWLVSSGPVITETDVARVVKERCGEALQQRRAALRALESGRAAPQADEALAVGLPSSPNAPPAPEPIAATGSTAITMPTRRPEGEARSRFHMVAYSLMILVSLIGVAVGLTRPTAPAIDAQTAPATQPVFQTLPPDRVEPEALDVSKLPALPVASGSAKQLGKARAPQPVASPKRASPPIKPQRVGPLEREL